MSLRFAQSRPPSQSRPFNPSCGHRRREHPPAMEPDLSAEGGRLHAAPLASARVRPEYSTFFRINKPNLAIQQMSRAARSRPSARASSFRPSGANGSSVTRPLSSCHVPATKPSTRIVACTIPLFVTMREGGTSPRIRDRSACESTRLSKRGTSRTGAGRVGVRQRRAREVVEDAPLLVAERSQRLPLERGGDRRKTRDAGPLPDVLLRRRPVGGEIAADELVECLFGWWRPPATVPSAAV